MLYNRKNRVQTAGVQASQTAWSWMTQRKESSLQESQMTHLLQRVACKQVRILLTFHSIIPGLVSTSRLHCLPLHCQRHTPRLAHCVFVCGCLSVLLDCIAPCRSLDIKPMLLRPGHCPKHLLFLLVTGDKIMAATIHLDHLTKNEVQSILKVLEPYDNNMKVLTASPDLGSLGLGLKESAEVNITASFHVKSCV